jgi:multidrug efflux pump subunit AcrB
MLALTDYADRYLVDKLSSIDGVSQVDLGGGKATPCVCGPIPPRWPRGR